MTQLALSFDDNRRMLTMHEDKEAVIDVDWYRERAYSRINDIAMMKYVMKGDEGNVLSFEEHGKRLRSRWMAQKFLGVAQVWGDVA